MYFLLLSVLLSLFSSNSFAGSIQQLILSKLSMTLPDSNSRTVSNSYDICSITVSGNSSSMWLRIKKKYEGLNCQAEYGASFEIEREQDCRLENDGKKQIINCAWKECETQGCVDRENHLTIEGNVFKIGNVKCDLGRRSRTGAGDVNCHP